MIKNVIFDLGNVLIDFKPIKYIKSLGYDDEKALEIFNKTIKDSIWADMDRGIYRDKESYVKAFEEKYPEIQDDIDKDDVLEINLEKGLIINKTKNKEYNFKPYPAEIQKLINSGGLVNYTKEKAGK